MKNLKDNIYVGLQLLLLIIFFFDYDIWKFEVPQLIEITAIIIGFIGGSITILALMQLGGSLSPFPSPKKNSELITSGLFRYVRHPIYTGIILSTFSLSIFLGSSWKLGVSILLMILFYLKSIYEEQKLAEKYPGYHFYRENTGRFLPKMKEII
mgnify:CR=1 FL=1